MQLVAPSFALLNVSTGQGEHTKGTCVVFQNFPVGQRAVVVVVEDVVLVLVLLVVDDVVDVLDVVVRVVVTQTDAPVAPSV